MVSAAAGSGGGSGVISEGVSGGEGGNMRSQETTAHSRSNTASAMASGGANGSMASQSEIMNAESGSTAFTNSK